MEVDIKKLKSIRKELESLKDDDVLYVSEDGISKYVVMNISLYDNIESIVELMEQADSDNIDAKVLTPEDIELSYEQYEEVKQKINELIDASLKPKPEKMN